MKQLDIRAGVYRDSVRLMQISSALAGLDGIDDALVAMATPVNLELAAGLGFTAPAASPNDMLIAVSARSDDALAAALSTLDELLASSGAPAASGSAIVHSRTTGAAVVASGANLVLVSTPGRTTFAKPRPIPPTIAVPQSGPMTRPPWSAA